MVALLNISPSPGVAPGAVGGFPANPTLSRHTPITFNVPTNMPVEINIQYLTDGSVYTVHDGTGFRGDFQFTSSRTAATVGFNFSILPRLGWTNTSISIDARYVTPEGIVSSSDLMNALGAVGDLTLNAGVYTIDVPVVVPNNSILRAGPGVEFRCTGSGYNAFVLNGLDTAQLLLNGAKITRPGYTTSTTAGISIQSCKRVVVDGADIQNQGNGVFIKDCISPVPHVSTAGTAGSTGYAYVVLCTVDGVSFEVKKSGAITTGNATLSGSNYNVIEWGDLLCDFNSTISYDVYRTIGGATQGYIGSVAAGVRIFNDTGIAATGTLPRAPKQSPKTNCVTVGTAGTATRTYTVIACIDGVDWGVPYTSTKTTTNATLTMSNYNVIAWPRLYNVFGKVSEVYKVYRTASTVGGETLGLIGTIDATAKAPTDVTAYELNDTGLTASGALPATPVSTKNYNIDLRNVTVSHDSATSANNQYGIQVNSVEYLNIEQPNIQNMYLDGGKLRHEGIQTTISGGCFSYNGVSLNNGSSGDGLDCFAGVQRLVLRGVEFIGNGANGITTKTVQWTTSLQVGVPEYGVPASMIIDSCTFRRNAGSGLQVEGLPDSSLGGSNGGIVRPRVKQTIVNNCIFDINDTYGCLYNGYGATFTNCIFRSNAQEGLYLEHEANSVDFIGCTFAGNWATNPAAGSGVTCTGTATTVTLASDLSAGATSFSIPSATGIPASGKVSLGRKVAGVAPSSFIETYRYTLVGTTVTLYGEQPGSAAVSVATVFDHKAAQGTNALDVVFLFGARHVRFIECKSNGKAHDDQQVFSLEGDWLNTVTTQRNHVEVFEGADEIYWTGGSARYCTSDTYGSPLVPISAADGCFVGRCILDYTDPYQTTVQNKYFGSPGSIWRSQPASAGTSVTFMVKETGFANNKAGWVFK